MKRMGATPGKLALVGVLAVVLGTVLVGQLPDSTTTPEVARRPRTPMLNQSNSTAAANQPRNIQQRTHQSQPRPFHSNSSTKSREQSSEPPTWPDLSLETIVAFDPFATPQWLSSATAAAQAGPVDTRLLTEAARRARKASVLKDLQDQGTTIVVITSDDKRATIGNQTFRIGDHLEGFVITDITRQGVVLTEFEQ